jgi:hypothetical protein
MKPHEVLVRILHTGIFKEHGLFDWWNKAVEKYEGDDEPESDCSSDESDDQEGMEA